MTRCRLALVIAVTLAPAIAAAQSAQILHAFGVEPGLPRYGIVQAPDGSLYGTAVVGGRNGVIYRLAPGGPLSVVHRFESGFSNSGLVRGPDGVLYGTTGSGGAASRGYVFGFDPASGALYEFTNADDGVSIGGVTFGPDGLLYGATYYGGALGSAGTLYRVDPATGATAIFHQYSNSGPAGRSPNAGITLAGDGRLYGATRLSSHGSVNAIVAQTLVVPAFMQRSIDVETLPGLAQASFSIVVESDRFVVVPPLVKTYTLPPLSRTTIAVDTEGPALAGTDVAAAIEATAPIIVERAMYASRPGQPFAAGHDSAGVVAPALAWFLAEGATGPFFDLFVLVANPNPTPAAITVEYLVLGGGALTKDYVVPANGRFTIWVDDEQLPAGSGQKPLANAAVSTTVRATNGVPIVVERTLWWPGPELTPDYWYEAHNSPGSTATARRWAFADGDVGGASGAETYVLIANPEAVPGRVRVTAYFDNGTNVTRSYDVPAKSRTNVPLSVDLPDTPAHARFGVVVESVGLNPVPIVVERAMYASPGGVTWASGSNALATPLP